MLFYQSTINPRNRRSQIYSSFAYRIRYAYMLRFSVILYIPMFLYNVIAQHPTALCICQQWEFRPQRFSSLSRQTLKEAAQLLTRIRMPPSRCRIRTSRPSCSCSYSTTDPPPEPPLVVFRRERPPDSLLHPLPLPMQMAV